MKVRLILNNKTDKFENYFQLKKHLLSIDTSELKELEIFISEISILIVALLYQYAHNFNITVVLNNKEDFDYLKFLKLDRFIKIIFSETRKY